jgi:hypothetical protein
LIWKTTPQEEKKKYKEKALAYRSVGFVLIFFMLVVGFGGWWVWPTSSVPASPTPQIAPKNPIAPDSVYEHGEFASVSFIYNFSTNNLVEIDKSGIKQIMVKQSNIAWVYNITCFFDIPIKDIIEIKTSAYASDHSGRIVYIYDTEQLLSSISFNINLEIGHDYKIQTEKIVISFNKK